MSRSKATMEKNMINDEQLREKLSAWMDGEGKAPDAQQLQDPEVQVLWETYHLMGDVMRDPSMAGFQPSDRFRKQLQERLVREPKPRSRFNTLRYTMGTAAMVACVALVVWAFHTPIQTAFQREQINVLAKSSTQDQEMLRQTYQAYVNMHTTMVTLSPIDDDMTYIKPGAPGTKVMPSVPVVQTPAKPADDRAKAEKSKAEKAKSDKPKADKPKAKDKPKSSANAKDKNIHKKGA